ncbi:hypothetical protein H5410_050503 [Solanum commersonii]|uniref:Uncharacterized protein n=1 Tax=Solanum commersonii TaxID=4109 RepID=A0A9J5WXS7_SOLCO|nr:hypothetical protein H5410_050503 [Solanum commersonii]
MAYCFVNVGKGTLAMAALLNNMLLSLLKIRKERLKKFLDLKKEKNVVEEPKSNLDSDTMTEIDNYEDNSAQVNDDVKSSEEKMIVEMRRVVDIPEILEMRMMIPCPCQFVQEKSLVWIYEAFPHLGKYAKKSSDSRLPIPHLLRLYMTKSDNIIEGDPFKYKEEIVHPYLTPTIRETKQSYMATLKSYTDEVKDTVFDALKANLKGVIVLTSRVASLEQSMMEVVAFIRDEKLRTQKNKKNKAVDEDYTTPTVDEDGVVVDVDEILPLAIINENLVAVDEYFAEKVNEVVKDVDCITTTLSHT